MTKLSRRFLLLTALTIMTGCGVLQKQTVQRKTLEFDKKWVRSTLLTDYLKYRVIHRFQPILHKGMVIQGNAIDGIVAYDRNTGVKVWKKYID